MAQSGYTPILIYASGTASALPSAANLTSSANGAELALNYADGKLYYKNSSGVVTLLASAAAASGTSPGGSNTQVQYNNSGAFAGSANFVFDGTNVGIGTSSPGVKLTVSYTAAAGNIAHFAGANNVNGYIGAHALSNGGLYINSNQANQDLRLQTQGTDRVILDSSGNLGLGVTPSAWNSGVRMIEFVGAAIGSNNTPAQMYLASNAILDSGGWKYKASNYAAKQEIVNGYFAWFTAPSGTAGNAITFTQAMTLDSSGNLGIGTSSPSGKLHVVQATASAGSPAAGSFFSGDDSAAIWRGALKVQHNSDVTISSGSSVGITFQPLASTGSTYFGAAAIKAVRENATANNQNTALTFWTRSGASDSTDSAERMRLDSSGNLGLGVTPSAWGGSQKAIQNGSRSVWSTNGSNTGIGLNVYNDGGANRYIANGAANLYQQDGAHSWYTAPSGTAGNAITFTQAMTLDASGNLGLGTSSPSAYGSTTTFTIAGNTYAEVDFKSGSTLIGYAACSASALEYTTAGVYPILFKINSTERARISSTGGFSVGTTADPGAGAIYATGNITAYYSDARLKDVKGTITNALDKVSSLSGVYYTNNEVAVAHGYTSAETQVGLLAQDVEAVLPEVVKAAPFDLDERGDSKSGEHYKTVQYERIIPLLVEAIKELRAEVKALRGE